MKAFFVLCASAAMTFAVTGCNAVSSGTALSSVPYAPNSRVFLTTGDAPKKYRTLGFVQVRGYGVEVAGLADVGNAGLDTTIKGALAEEAAKMGGNGVVHIEFLDENPSTDMERIQAAVQTAQSFTTNKPKVEQKDRYVTVSGEVILFTE